MSYDSVNALQQTLATSVFHYTQDKKKAAGRALGTIVEIIAFYLLKQWGHERNIAIERRVPEYANASLTHNVEFTLHPIIATEHLKLNETKLPLSSSTISKALTELIINRNEIKSTQLLSRKNIIRNACTIQESSTSFTNAYLGNLHDGRWDIVVEAMRTHPFAMFECKRVGVEDGMKKGPQTIEKAKQGAYVARMVSSLQKIRLRDGTVTGIMHMPDGKLVNQPYDVFLKQGVESNNKVLLKEFMLTVGMVSNHGNWFTSENHNKELDVLAQAYDWLLFLTDRGLSTFVNDLLLNPTPKYKAAQSAFLSSYTGRHGVNSFTKVQIDLDADAALQSYFAANLEKIESWFNVIAPFHETLKSIKKQLKQLCNKDWEAILK